MQLKFVSESDTAQYFPLLMLFILFQRNFPLEGGIDILLVYLAKF